MFMAKERKRAIMNKSKYKSISKTDTESETMDIKKLRNRDKP